MKGGEFYPGATVIVGPIPPNHPHHWLNLKIGILKCSTTSFSRIHDRTTCHWSVKFPKMHTWLPKRMTGNKYQGLGTSIMDIEEKWLTVCFTTTSCICELFVFQPLPRLTNYWKRDGDWNKFVKNDFAPWNMVG